MMENLYLPGTKTESMNAEIARLRKRTNILTVFIIITIMLLSALAVIYFLNIEVTPYQTGSKSLFGAGQNPNNPSQANTAEINANLTKRLSEVEAQLNALQAKVMDATTATNATLAHTRSIGRQSDSKAKQMNKTLNKTTGKLRERIEDVEKSLISQVQKVNNSMSKKDEKLDENLMQLQQLIHQLQETDGSAHKATNASLNALRRGQSQLQDKLQVANESMHMDLEKVRSQVKKLGTEVAANMNSSKELQENTERLLQDVDEMKNAVVALENNSTRPHELLKLREDLQQYSDDAAGIINNKLAANKQRVATAFGNITELGKEVALNISKLRGDAETKSANNDRNLALFRQDVLAMVQNKTGAVFPHLEALKTSLLGKHEALNGSIAMKLETIPERLSLFEERLGSLATNVSRQLTQANNFITNINTQVVDAASATPPNNTEEILAALQPRLDAINLAVEAKISKLSEIEKIKTKVSELDAAYDTTGDDNYEQITEEEPASFG